MSDTDGLSPFIFHRDVELYVQNFWWSWAR